MPKAESRNASGSWEKLSLQPGLVGAGVIVPLAGLVGSLIFRHQLNIQRRHVPKRVAFSAMDCLIIVGLYRLVPNAIEALTIMKADIVAPLAPCRFQIVLALEIPKTAAADQLYCWKFAG